MVTRKELSKFIAKQTAEIQKWKDKGEDSCPLIQCSDDIKACIVRYFFYDIGYDVKEGRIYFRHIRFMPNTDITPSSVFVRKRQDRKGVI